MYIYIYMCVGVGQDNRTLKRSWRAKVPDATLNEGANANLGAPVAVAAEPAQAFLARLSA